MALVGALGHTSGCHLNPAVTLGLASIGKFPWRYVPVYIAAQMVGAVLAGFALWGAYGSPARTVAHLGATAPTPGSSDLQTFFMEVLIGFVLVLVIVSMATESRVSGAAVAVCIGLTLAACVLVSGGAANPARALGPMIVSLKSLSVWAYVLGPLVGGVLGAVVYDKFIGPTTAPDEEHAASANDG